MQATNRLWMSRPFLKQRFLREERGYFMLKLKKPGCLHPGDRVATVSLSWGAAGDPEIYWRYALGKQRLEQEFGLQVVEMPHTLAPTDYVSAHPEARAADLMQAMCDDSIRAVFNVIGGNDSIRMLPYLDFDALAKHPKIFTGYSDGTVTDYICMKAGFSSFYGAHVLNDFAEPGQMPPYIRRLVRKMMFETEPVGEIPACAVTDAGDLSWREKDQPQRRCYVPDTGYRCLQPGKARGTLIGGCFEVFEDLKNTVLFPEPEAFDGSIFFYEVCGEPDEEKYRRRLRYYGEQGILQRISGLLMGKPLGGRAKELLYDRVTREVLAEYGRDDLPVLSNASFGHNSPSGVIPMGAMAEIDCDTGRFTVLEPTVV